MFKPDEAKMYKEYRPGYLVHNIKGNICITCGDPLTPATAEDHALHCYRCDNRACQVVKKNGELCGREISRWSDVRKCPVHGGRTLYADSILTVKASNYDEEKQSDSKKLVRAQLYEHVAEKIGVKIGAEDFFIIPGMYPAHEINVIRDIFNNPHITAFDCSFAACKEAIKAGADCAVYGDLENINVREARECLRYTSYSFMHIDLCGHYHIRDKGGGPLVRFRGLLRERIREQ